MRHVTLAVLTLAPCVAAQGAVTDGNVFYRFLNVPSSTASTSGQCDFSATPKDAAFQHWWYYCIAGDSGASAFNSQGSQLTESYGGNTARLRWGDADGRGLRADWVLSVHSTGASSGFALSRMTVTNTNAAPVTLDVYAYVDVDLCFSFSDDSAVGSTVAADLVHTLTDASCSDQLQLYASAADRDEVGAYPSVHAKLSNQGGSCPQLGPLFAGAGGNFGPDDYTGAFQWSQRTLQAGESLTAFVVMSHNHGFQRCPSAAAAANYCRSTDGTNGTPVFRTTLLPMLQSGGEVRVENGLADAAAILNVGAAQVCQSVLGVSMANLGDLIPAPVALDQSGDASVFVGLPNDAGLCGRTVYLQFIWFDAGSVAQIPVAATDGITWTIGH